MNSKLLSTIFIFIALKPILIFAQFNIIPDPWQTIDPTHFPTKPKSTLYFFASKYIFKNIRVFQLNVFTFTLTKGIS